MPDLPIALFYDVLAQAAARHVIVLIELAYLYDEHVLVIGTVKNCDLSARGQAFEGAPQEIVRQLALRRRLERIDPDALRVEAAHYMLDGAVLARGIHRLQMIISPSFASE